MAVRQYNHNCRMLARGERPKKLRVHPRIRTVLTEFRWAKREASADIGDPDVNMMSAVENIQVRYVASVCHIGPEFFTGDFVLTLRSRISAADWCG